MRPLSIARTHPGHRGAFPRAVARRRKPLRRVAGWPDSNARSAAAMLACFCLARAVSRCSERGVRMPGGQYLNRISCRGRCIFDDLVHSAVAQDPQGDGLNPLGGRNRGHRVSHDRGPAGFVGNYQSSPLVVPERRRRARTGRRSPPLSRRNERIRSSLSPPSPPAQQAPAADAGTTSRPGAATVACAAAPVVARRSDPQAD